MKKLLKTTTAAFVIILMACLYLGMTAFAETAGGEITEGFTWFFDTETSTLTITGEGMLPSSSLDELVPWADYSDNIHRVYLNGITDSQEISRHLKKNTIQSVSGRLDGDIVWNLNIVAYTLLIDGTGEMKECPWIGWYSPSYTQVNVVIGDGISNVEQIYYPISTLTVGKSYAGNYFLNVEKSITAAAENPYISTYEGCVYTKDFSKLLYCPFGQQNPVFYPNVKAIGTDAFHGSQAHVLTLPWGVTTIESNAFRIAGNRPKVIIPDTVTSMQQTTSGGKDCSVLFIYSKSNKAVDNAIGGKTDAYDRPISNPVASLYEYYPDHISVPQTPDSSESSTSGPSGPPSQPSEPSRPAESQSAESSSASSVPTASKTAASSTPTSSTPQSKPQPESSTPAESSAPAEESKPAESESVPESVTESVDISENSEAPSSEAAVSSEESSQPDPKDQETGGRSGATIPLVIALCAALAAVGVLLFLLLRKKEK